ncbi:MAG: histidine kinase [Actinoplanes sp.]
MRRSPRTKNPLPWIAAAITFVAVPAGLALTGGSTDSAMTGSLTVWLALLMVFVRRWPLTVLITGVLSVAAMRGADLVHAGWVWPVTAAFVATTLSGRVRPAIVVGVVTLWYGFIWDYFVSMHSFDWAVGRIGGEGLWLAAALALTLAYSSTRRWQQEVAARLQQSLHEQQLETRRRRAEERVDIARDLHDVVSHTLAVVGVHLNVALDSFDEEPQEAREALRLAQDVRGRAMTDLKALVDVLREGAADHSPAAGLEGLAGLAEQVRAAGIEVIRTESGERADVPAPVATAVYRVVQESLTNTVRHARATRTRISVHYEPTGVTVDVCDDGTATTDIVEGHGIMGMRERVAALGGALTAGPAEGGGFRVRATIPIAV